MFNDAIYYFKKIIREAQQDKDLALKAEYELANILYQIGEEQSAIKKYSQFIKSHPNSEITPTLVFWLGQYYHKNSQFERARRNFETLVRMYPKHNLAPEAKYQIGLIFLSEGKYDNALQMLERLLDITDQKSIRAKTMLAIGDLLSQDGQQEKAIEVYNELTQLISPKDIESVIKSMPKQKIESEVLADAEIKITTESKQDDVDSNSGFQFVKLAYVRLGDIYQERKEFQKAVSFYSEALKYPLDENSASIQFKIAESYEEDNDLDSALEAYSNISENFEQDIIWIVKGLLRSSRVYEDKREWKAALEAYQRIIDYDVPEAKYAQERLTLIKKQIELY